MFDMSHPGGIKHKTLLLKIEMNVFSDTSMVILKKRLDKYLKN